MQREGSDAANHHEFDRQRAAILSQAVGLARLSLREGHATNALATLDSAVARTRSLHEEFLRREGFSEEAIRGFLG